MRVALVLAAALAAGCVDKGVAPGPGPVVPMGIAFALNEGDLDRGANLPQMNLSQTRDLWVRVRVPGMPRVTSTKLAFHKPTGEVFWEQETPFSPDPAMKTMEGGLDHPVQVFPAKSIPGGFALDQAIPIGGTVFERFPATGTWMVDATVEGQTTVYHAPLDVIVRR